MLEASTWKYVENQFRVIMMRSRVASNAVVQDHFSKLKAAAGEPGADARIGALYTSFTAVKTIWDKEYSDWKNAEASYGGMTTSFETLLSRLAVKPGPEESSKIEEWDVRIQAAAARGSALYRTLLPDGRAPFSDAKRDQIVQNVKDLGIRLSEQTTKPALVTLGTEVTDFYNQLRTAREAQQGAEGTESGEADELTPVQSATATALYANLGMLMHVYAENPVMITSFFDLTILRANSAKKTSGAKTAGSSPA